MRAYINRLKKHWTLVWLICVMLLSVSFISFAAYTGLKSVKRVVTTRKAVSALELFSSNCMKSSFSTKMITSNQYSVSICNYDQSDPLTVNTSNIDYTFTVELAVRIGDDYKLLSELQTENPSAYQECITRLSGKSYTVRKTEDDGTVVTGTTYTLDENNLKQVFTGEHLAKDRTSTDRFQVAFDISELQSSTPNFYVYVTADKLGDSTSFLQCYLFASPSTSEASAWKGELLETGDYSFYNYIVSGSGVGTVRIFWNPQYFELNPFFQSTLPAGSNVTDNGIYADSGSPYYGWRMMTIVVNSTVQNRYELQLYKTQRDTSYTGANAASQYVAYKYTED